MKTKLEILQYIKTLPNLSSAKKVQLYHELKGGLCLELQKEENKYTMKKFYTKIKQIYRKLIYGNRFHGLLVKDPLKVKIEYAWSGNLGITNDRIPIIKTRGDLTIIGGAASQIMCLMSAEYLAHQIMRREHPLDFFFLHMKRTSPKKKLFSS